MKKEIDLISYEEILGETGQIKQIPHLFFIFE